ncbi:MAG TPA: hypothetical protein VH186_21255 [Chloroflexia bacterium]|nr:hypothetical protein [Chloroflexia bacterium]
MSEANMDETGKAGKNDPALNWAHPVSNLKANVAEKKAPNRVDGRQLLGALQGFGPMWQKTYTITLRDTKNSPAYIITTWKENFGRFWPSVNRFYAPITGIQPGEIGLIKGSVPGGLTLSTGVMVIYVDEESFTFMTPQGHIFAGWVTFSAYQDSNHTRVQVQVLMRSPDPLIEMALRMGGHRAEDKFWLQTLENLSRYFGEDARAQANIICLDKKIQWREIRNLRHNGIIGSTFYTFTAPVRLLGANRRKK